MIKIGCCIPGGSFMPEGVAEIPQSPAEQLIAKCHYVMDCGYDYTECGGMMLAGLSEEELCKVEAENQKKSLGLYAVNSLFPGSYKLANPGDRRNEIETYVKHLVDVLSRLGIRYAVFGSGAARSIPEDMDKEEGLANLRNFMHFFADYAEPRGVTLVIEPLRTRESNVYCTVPVCDEEVRRLDRAGVKLLADAFHMAEEKTEPEAVEVCGDRLLHCHMAEAPDRTCPGQPTTGDLAFNQRFAASLRKSGYTGGVSAECGFTDFTKNVPEILAYMKTLFPRD